MCRSESGTMPLIQAGTHSELNMTELCLSMKKFIHACASLAKFSTYMKTCTLAHAGMTRGKIDLSQKADRMC